MRRRRLLPADEESAAPSSDVASFLRRRLLPADEETAPYCLCCRLEDAREQTSPLPTLPTQNSPSSHQLTTHSRSTVFYCYCWHLIFLFLIYWFTCVGRGRLLRALAGDGWTSSTMWERTFCWRACSLRTNLIP